MLFTVLLALLHCTVGVHRWFKRDPSGKGTVFEPAEPEVYDITGAVPLVIPAGTLVLLHHALVHFRYNSYCAVCF